MSGVLERVPRVTALLLVAASLLACGRPRAERVGGVGGGAGAASPISVDPVNAPPNATSAPLTGPRKLCPLTVEPGVSFGPVKLGESLPELEDAGLVVTRFSRPEGATAPKGGHADLVIPLPDGLSVALKVSICAGRVTQVWIEDLRQAPDCVVFRGQPLSRSASREDVARALGACVDSGGVARCQDGGVHVAHGTSPAVEIRVVLRALALDGGCPPATR